MFTGTREFAEMHTDMQKRYLWLNVYEFPIHKMDSEHYLF